MVFYKIKNSIVFTICVLVTLSCSKGSQLPQIKPDVITEKTVNDTDDPAIWIHPTDPSKSIVFGTDKKTNGAVYAFNLEGKIIEDKTIRNIKRPNNVDLEYGFKINDSTTTDILVFTEREKQQIRIFSVPEMKPLDNGGLPVFKDEKKIENRLPMGVAFYKSPIDSSFYAIVGRKRGPKEKYLYQYKLIAKNGTIKTELVRKFGNFSGKKEIEAIAVDGEMGFVYYADERHCIRKYYAEPTKGNTEISCFGGDYFLADIEGIAIAKMPDKTGYLIISDQKKGQFNLFDRTTNAFVKAVNLSTLETDGCEVVTVPLNDTFKSGLFVAMNSEKNFYFYDLDKLLK
ncbi:phytase [Polaribacter batillariae]|uniref:Phytase n=1 Tax=Polaribacter batillariae TaxID=2808900 RepID=A0ABX7SWJ2_9FLAO|nr:phytase [Polaribacter batillariae]QTD38561.1 phytase [Polaribacter batillariae]